jgi:hypothetical protein
MGCRIGSRWETGRFIQARIQIFADWQSKGLTLNIRHCFGNEQS